MEQLEMLWQYQKADIAADRFEDEMRCSPNRIKLLKSRDFILQQQSAIKNIEKEVHSMADRIDILKEAVKLTKDQLSTLEKQFEASAPTSLEEAKSFSKDAQKLVKTINDYTQEIDQINALAIKKDQEQYDIRVKAAKVKLEFDQVKTIYDKELKAQTKDLEVKRQEAKKLTKGIDKDLLEKYNSIKAHVKPPIAKLYHDQCGGCNMALPSATLRTLKSDEVIVECENCGRMLFL